VRDIGTNLIPWYRPANNYLEATSWPLTHRNFDNPKR
jgi:hypothetical protein